VMNVHYASLRPHLMQKIRAELEAENSIHILLGSVANHYYQAVSEEIARIEKKWKLI
jgi:hypothetical protein